VRAHDWAGGRPFIPRAPSYFTHFAPIRVGGGDHVRKQQQQQQHQ